VAGTPRLLTLARVSERGNCRGDDDDSYHGGSTMPGLDSGIKIPSAAAQHP